MASFDRLRAIALLGVAILALHGCTERSPPSAGKPVVQPPKSIDPVAGPTPDARIQVALSRLCGSWRLEHVARLTDGQTLALGAKKRYLVLRADHTMSAVIEGEPPVSGTFEVLLGKSRYSPEPAPLLVTSDAPDLKKTIEFSEEGHLNLLDSGRDGAVSMYVPCAPEVIPVYRPPGPVEIDLPKLCGTWKLQSVDGGMDGRSRDERGSEVVLVLRPDHSAETFAKGVSTGKSTYRVLMGKSIFASEPQPILVMKPVRDPNAKPTPPRDGAEPVGTPVEESLTWIGDGRVIRFGEDDTLSLSENHPDGFNSYYIRSAAK